MSRLPKAPQPVHFKPDQGPDSASCPRPACLGPENAAPQFMYREGKAAVCPHTCISTPKAGDYLGRCRHRTEEGGPGALFAVFQVLLVLTLLDTVHFAGPISCELRTHTQEVVSVGGTRPGPSVLVLHCLSAWNSLRLGPRLQRALSAMGQGLCPHVR